MTYPNPTIRSNAVDGADVADGSLTGADIDTRTLGMVPKALLGGMGSASSYESVISSPCDPETTAFLTCASVPMFLPEATNVTADRNRQGPGRR